MSPGTIHQPTTIISEENLELHETSRIDSFCLINAQGGVTIEEQSVIHAGSHIVGSDSFQMGSRSAITYNCVMLTSTADLRYPASTAVPKSERQSISGAITLEKEIFVGAGSVIMPGVTLHEGAVVAANSFITEDVPEWTIRYPDGSEQKREWEYDATNQRS